MLKVMRLKPNGDPAIGWKPSHITSVENFTSDDHSERDCPYYTNAEETVFAGVWECAPCKAEVAAFPYQGHHPAGQPGAELHKNKAVLSVQIALGEPLGLHLADPPHGAYRCGHGENVVRVILFVRSHRVHLTTFMV